LRTHQERPSRRAAKPRDELAPFHSTDGHQSPPKTGGL
jgi:hypothetical protein